MSPAILRGSAGVAQHLDPGLGPHCPHCISPSLLPPSPSPFRSYGPCQFPTLGLIVQRAWEIQAHITENFWYIQASEWEVVHTAQKRSAMQRLHALGL